MNSKYYVIKFLHPGSEPRPGNNNIIPWNSSDKHKRKFINIKGKYIKTINERKTRSGKIGFWGEWEPPSKVISNTQLLKSEPKNIYEPILEKYQPNLRLLGTDPFVFGEKFYYSICQKNNKTLQNLTTGSLILFGSSKEKRFILDTLFVVGNKAIEFKKEQDIQDKVASEFMEATIKPIIYNKCKNIKCYKKIKKYKIDVGATFYEREHEMFSYFPCSIDGNTFKRPEIRIDSVINGRQTQGIRIEEYQNLECVYKMWKNIASQVENNKLFFGIKADMPKFIL